MRKYVVMSLVLILLGFQAKKLQGQAVHTSIADCKGALSKDYYRYADDKSLTVDWLKSIDQETYESAKKDNSFDALAIFSGGMLSLKDDYSSFDEKRNKYLENQQYHRSYTDAKRIVSMTTSERAYQAYETCLRSIAANGVSVWATRVAQDRIDLVVRYANPPGRSTATLSGTITGGKVIGAPPGKLWGKDKAKWGTNAEKPFTIITDRGTPETTVRVQDNYGSPIVDATFLRADGELTIVFEGSTPVLRTRDSRYTGPLSPNNHENKSDNCPNYVGRKDGKYCMSRTSMTITTTAPRFFTNARSGCLGEGCPWSYDGVPPAISADGLAATTARDNWGRQVNPVLIVDEWEHLGRMQCSRGDSVIPVIEGQQVLLAVPTECLAIANLKWKLLPSGSSSGVKFGEGSPTGEPGVTIEPVIVSGDATLASYTLCKSSPTARPMRQFIQ